MDQDFHYYGTYTAAINSGWGQKKAALVAKAANFVDFLNEATYRGYWDIKDKDYTVGQFYAPRYTFQANLSGQGFDPADQWLAFHFLPGNYKDDTLPLTKTHSEWARKLLPSQILRPVKSKYSQYAKYLTRPLSAASRYLIEDTVRLSQNPEESYDILLNASAASYLLCIDHIQRKKTIDRFITILAGIRAHVIADTWAHQDWAGVASDINTYWDNSDSWGTFLSEGNYSIKYQFRQEGLWHTVVLKSGANNENLKGAPNFFGNLGHGWMGHLPDFSFIKYKYRPAWDADKTEYLRDNHREYRFAFIELMNLFQRMSNTSNPFDDRKFVFVNKSIQTSMNIDDDSLPVRVFSAKMWISQAKIPNNLIIDVKKEPSPEAVLDGKVTEPNVVSGKTAYGTFALDLKTPKGNICDLYLFHIAADYHFHFVREWLQQKKIASMNDSWSTAPGPLVDVDGIYRVIRRRIQAITEGKPITAFVKFGNDNNIKGPVTLSD